MNKLEIITSAHLKSKLPLDKLLFGKTFTDHMFRVDWNHQRGWFAPQIVPYGPISLYPSAASLHYGLECFEGMKAYRDKKNNIRLFRPDKNMVRMNNSSARMTLPTFDGGDLIAGISALLKLDKDWIPTERGYSVYVRPTAFATQPEVGVCPVKESMIVVLCSPVGPYYPEGFKPVSLFADSVHVRACPGGVGAFKIGGNYAASVFPQQEAAKKGFSQVLWLWNDQVTEVGTMNMFVYWVNEQGQKELITPSLNDGMILPGVTRLSILELTRQWGEFKVTEGQFTIQQLLRAHAENRILECFGAGTAAIVCPIKLIHYQDRDYKIPLDKNDASAPIGPLTKRLADTIMAIQYGEVEHPWSVVI